MDASPTVADSTSTRYRLDDLRKLGSTLGGAVGIAPARAAALASHLLWFDAAGASKFGIATLADWLDRVDRKEIDPIAEGKVGPERPSTAVFDGQNGLTPLALGRAAGIASEKARELGVGVVRVRNLPSGGPSAPIASNLAVGPYVAAIVGPGPMLSLALPRPGGPPAVLDSALDGEAEGPAREWLTAWAPWISGLSGDDGWTVLALAIPALEPLATFHERVAGGPLGRPSPWEENRREALDRGVTLDGPVLDGLRGWAGRLGVAWPLGPEG